MRSFKFQLGFDDETCTARLMIICFNFGRVWHLFTAQTVEEVRKWTGSDESGWVLWNHLFLEGFDEPNQAIEVAIEWFIAQGLPEALPLSQEVLTTP